MIYTDGTPTIASAGACLPSAADVLADHAERTAAADRLEELRKALRSETISYAELAELQSLADRIDPSDVELLEAAGVPEHPDRYVVTENTPGYLPEDDEPATFATFDEALDYAADLAEQLHEAGYAETNRGIDRERETAFAWFYLPHNDHDLGRVVEVSRLEVE